MQVLIARFAAVIAAALVTWILGVLNLPVSQEEAQGVIEWLTTGLTAGGMFAGLALYGLFHKLISRKTNPADTAAHPNVAAERVGLK